MAASQTKKTNEQSKDVDDKQRCQPPEVTDREHYTKQTQNTPPQAHVEQSP